VTPQLPYGIVRDSNRPQLLALCLSHSYDAIDAGIVEDE
jgi:molybdopterin biosynthesis enzyme